MPGYASSVRRCASSNCLMSAALCVIRPVMSFTSSSDSSWKLALETPQQDDDDR